MEVTLFIRNVRRVPLRVGRRGRRPFPESIQGYVKAYLHEHLDQPLDLEALARQVHCTPQQLSRSFRETEGRTIREYLRGCLKNG